MKTSLITSVLALPAAALAQVSSQPMDLAQQIRASLDIANYEIQEIHVPSTAANEFTLEFSLGGKRQIVNAWPHSNRSADFRVLADRGHDQLLEVEVNAPQTFRGELLGSEGSVVAGSILNGQLHALVWAWEGGTYAIQPLSMVEPNADPASYVVYDVADTLPGDWGCIEVPSDELETRGQQTLGTGNRFCEIAFDCDVEFFNLNGGSLNNTVNDVELVMNLVNVIYDRDVDVLFGIGTIVVRTAEPDPYASADPNTILNNFRAHWTSTKTFIKRDTAHLMTGKNLTGSTIGIAFLSVICSQGQGFGVSQSRFSGNLNSRAGLTAHEVGHNYSAQHCSGSGCFIMCASLGGCGGDVTKFGASEQTQIENYSATRSCTPLLADPLTVPWLDTFEAGSIDNAIWPSVQGVVTSSLATGEPSGSNSANLDTVSAEEFADDYFRSNFVLLQGLSGKRVSLYTQHVGVEAGETLSVEYFANNGDWLTALTVVSDGIDQSAFELHSFDLPPNAYHNGFRLGIRVNGSSGDDEWYVDDVRIDDGCPQPTNYCVTTPNSFGPGAEITYAGSTSLASNDLQLIAFGAPAGQVGIFFYGPTQTQAPFGNGFICVSGGISRLPLISIDFFGDASMNFDAVSEGISAGATENFQFWFRDPMGGGSAFNLSNGLSTTWCP